MWPPVDVSEPCRSPSWCLVPAKFCLSNSVHFRKARGEENDNKDSTFCKKSAWPPSWESLGISDGQIKDFMASAAILNPSVMKACRSITHLFVFLLLWITVSVADSSLEWNGNKTIIHQVKLCRKGEKAMISFRSSALSPWPVIHALGNEERQLPGGGSGRVWLPLPDRVPFCFLRYPYLSCRILRSRLGTLGGKIQVSKISHSKMKTFLTIRIFEEWNSLP